MYITQGTYIVQVIKKHLSTWSNTLKSERCNCN